LRPDRATSTLLILRDKYASDEKRAAEGLADANRALEGAQRAKDTAELRLRSARLAVEQAKSQQASRLAAATTPEALLWAQLYLGRLKEQVEVETREVESAQVAVERCASTVAKARATLAEAKAKVEAVERRIEAARRAQREKAEAAAEEEAADRFRR
jgi:hypothetical protein